MLCCFGLWAVCRVVSVESVRGLREVLNKYGTTAIMPGKVDENSTLAAFAGMTGADPCGLWVGFGVEVLEYQEPKQPRVLRCPCHGTSAS